MILKVFLLVSLVCASLASYPPDDKKGGWRDRNVKDDDVVRAAKKSLAQYSKETNLAHTLVEIVKARSQIVSGVNYELKLKAKNKNGVVCLHDQMYEQVWTKTEQHNFKKC